MDISLVCYLLVTIFMVIFVVWPFSKDDYKRSVDSAATHDDIQEIIKSLDKLTEEVRILVQKYKK